MARPLDSQRIIAEVRAGHHDDRLSEINQATLKRADTAGARFRWRIRIDDLEITEDNLTLDECTRVEKFTDSSWADVDPGKSALMAGALLVIGLTSRRGVSMDDATKRIGELGASEVVSMIDKYLAEPSPLDQSRGGQRGPFVVAPNLRHVIAWFGAYRNWPPTQTRACLMGDLHDIAREVSSGTE